MRKRTIVVVRTLNFLWLVTTAPLRLVAWASSIRLANAEQKATIVFVSTRVVVSALNFLWLLATTPFWFVGWPPNIRLLDGEHSSMYRFISLSLALLFALGFAWPLLGHLSHVSGDGVTTDWDYFGATAFSTWQSVRHFHQFPFWDSYRCGGFPLLANPQSRVLTPMFLLQLALGPFIGMHLELPLHLLIAWLGAYALARTLAASGLAAAAAGSMYAGNSWFFLHYAVGHVSFLAMAYLPWILLCAWLASEEGGMRWAALGGLLVALTLGEGYVYQLPHIFLMLGVLSLALSLQQRSWRPIAVICAIGIFSVGFAAVKLLPVLEYIHARPTGPEDYQTTISQIATAVFSRNQSRYRTLQFHELGAYIGVWFGLLAALGIWSGFTRSLPWLLVALALLLLVCGGLPWQLLHRLPIFESFHIPSRLLIVVALALAPLSAFGVDALRHHSRLLAAAVVVLAVIDMWRIDTPIVLSALTGPPLAMPAAANFRQASGGSGRRMLSYAMANQGSVHCWEPAALRQSTAVGFDEGGYRGEQYLLGPGTVTLEKWTPNALTFEVATEQPSVMVVNQNYDRNWRLIEGRGEPFPYNGLIAVRLPAGRQRIELAYLSRAFAIGLLITILTGLATMRLWRFEARQDLPGSGAR